MAAEDWYAEATHDPGLNAGYRRGRTLNSYDVAHETVGRDSRVLIRDRGLAAWLFPKQGPPFQFAEANAITSHACEHNSAGCGYEVERFPGEPMTPDQTYWLGRVTRWRLGRYGVPLLHHWQGDGRLPIGTGFRGVADHGGLVHHACDQHTDGWSPQEWAAIVGTTDTTADDALRLMEDDMALIIAIKKGKATTGHVLADKDWTFGLDAKKALEEHARGTRYVEMPESEYKRFLTAYVFKDPEKVRPANL